MKTTQTPVVVLGVIGSDCHCVGNQILDAFFSERGYRVVNLGVMVSQEEFIHAAIESAAVAILVSSLYGHAEIDCTGFRQRCRERGLDDILLYIGGNLVVGKLPRAAIEQKFAALGFDRVFLAGDDLEIAAECLKSDLARRARRERRRIA
ncbi:MAG: methylaspartate mutase subunit S [Pirellulaceae bacterium]|jgi:methylaspartate mutase sigma subunit|nr:methylaspartate mutase subunit S [Pirellulaceae bacterium]